MNAIFFSRQKVINVLLSLPATLVWLPVCAHYLFVFGVMTAALGLQGAPKVEGLSPLVVAIGGAILSIAGLVGLAALWLMICCKNRIISAGKSPLLLLLSGLWIGFATCILVLSLAGYILLQSGFNLFVHSLIITVLGPIVVFLRELPRLQRDSLLSAETRAPTGAKHCR